MIGCYYGCLMLFKNVVHCFAPALCAGFPPKMMFLEEINAQIWSFQEVQGHVLVQSFWAQPYGHEGAIRHFG